MAGAQFPIAADREEATAKSTGSWMGRGQQAKVATSGKNESGNSEKWLRADRLGHFSRRFCPAGRIFAARCNTPVTAPYESA